MTSKYPKATHSRLPMAGWREWVSLPELGIQQIKAKLDTGARTSALYAFAITPFMTSRSTGETQASHVRFSVHPLQHNTEFTILCESEIIDTRLIKNSGGHKEGRYIIKTQICMGGICWPIEIALANRDAMYFRLILGRTAIKNQCIINPSQSFLNQK